MRRLLGILLLLSLGLPLLSAQNNPFLKGSKPQQEQISQEELGFFDGLKAGLGQIQKKLNQETSRLLRQIKEEGNPLLFLLMLGLALLYGIIHALGPGHGKMVIISYTLAHPLKGRNTVLLSFFMILTHTLSALLIVTVLYLVFKMSYFGSFAGQKRIISLVSYGLISALGLFLIGRFLLERLSRHREKAPRIFASPRAKMLELLSVALVIGLVPCEGAIFILIFTAANQIYWLGILMSFVMAIGMAATVSAIALLTLYSKKGLLKISQKNKSIQKIIISVLEAGSALAIFLFGFLLFLGACQL